MSKGVSYIAGHIDLGGGNIFLSPHLGVAIILYKKQVPNKNSVVNNPMGGKFMLAFSFGGIAPLPPAATCLKGIYHKDELNH